MIAGTPQNETAYDDLRRRIRHRHALKALASQRKRRRGWFLAYSFLVLATLAGVFSSTSKEPSLEAALEAILTSIYPQEAEAASEAGRSPESNPQATEQR